MTEPRTAGDWATLELPSAHDHGNCELCDWIERQWAEARQTAEDWHRNYDGCNAERRKYADKVRAQADVIQQMLSALEEVAHHADDECGFMVAVRVAMDAAEGVR